MRVGASRDLTILAAFRWIGSSGLKRISEQDILRIRDGQFSTGTNKQRLAADGTQVFACGGGAAR